MLCHLHEQLIVPMYFQVFLGCQVQVSSFSGMDLHPSGLFSVSPTTAKNNTHYTNKPVNPQKLLKQRTPLNQVNNNHKMFRA